MEGTFGDGDGAFTGASVVAMGAVVLMELCNGAKVGDSLDNVGPLIGAGCCASCVGSAVVIKTVGGVGYALDGVERLIGAGWTTCVGSAVAAENVGVDT
jgi:hypothetical protein